MIQVIALHDQLHLDSRAHDMLIMMMMMYVTLF